MNFLNRKGFLILILLLLKPSVVFAAPSFWDVCKRFFGLRATQKVVSSEPVTQEVDIASNDNTLKILLIRHAPTPDFNGDSSMERNEIIRIAKEQGFFSPTPLSKEGAEKFEKRCANLKGYSFDLLIHSPTMRAWQTAQIFLKYLPTEKVEKIIEVDEKGESYSYDKFFDAIKTHQAKSVVLVHHLPFLHLFLRKARGFGFEMQKGQMILLEFPYPYTPGSAQITEVMDL